MKVVPNAINDLKTIIKKLKNLNSGLSCLKFRNIQSTIGKIDTAPERWVENEIPEMIAAKPKR